MSYRRYLHNIYPSYLSPSLSLSLSLSLSPLPLSPPSLSLSPTLSQTPVATISFSEPMYSVMEGNNLTFEVIVEPQVALVREVEVTVTLMDGTAVGMFLLEIGT